MTTLFILLTLFTKFHNSFKFKAYLCPKAWSSNGSAGANKTVNLAKKEKDNQNLRLQNFMDRTRTRTRSTIFLVAVTQQPNNPCTLRDAFGILLRSVCRPITCSD